MTRRRRPWHVVLPVGLGVVGLVAATGVALDWETTRLSLLGVAALASIVLSVVLAGRARRGGDAPAAWLFAGHALLVLVLGGLGRAADPSVTMQWVDQLTNTVAQAGFLVAALRLSAATPAPPAAEGHRGALRVAPARATGDGDARV